MGLSFHKKKKKKAIQIVTSIPWRVLLCLHKYYVMSTRYKKEINKCHYIYSALIEFLEFNFIVLLCCSDRVWLKWISKLMSFIVPVCSAHSRSLTHNQDTQHAVRFGGPWTFKKAQIGSSSMDPPHYLMYSSLLPLLAVTLHSFPPISKVIQ